MPGAETERGRHLRIILEAGSSAVPGPYPKKHCAHAFIGDLLGSPIPEDKVPFIEDCIAPLVVSSSSCSCESPDEHAAERMPANC